MPQGLTTKEATALLKQYGSNILPQAKPPGMILIFFRQFLNPLIYILLIAALISIMLSDVSDAFFILLVIFINALIGTTQEYSAQKAADSLKEMVPNLANILRDGQKTKLESAKIVPGDVIFLESGDKAPADIELFDAKNLSINESMLTGESADVSKSAKAPDNKIFAGTMVVRGRGTGIVTATAMHSALGKIAASVTETTSAKPPLMQRMEKFTLRLAIITLIITAIIFLMSWYRGGDMREMLMTAVALAVAAIPEGLPAVITITLAIGMRRMAANNVIIRKLLAVEALGSCTMIASDKTGTLTINQLTARKAVLPDGSHVDIGGEDGIAHGKIIESSGDKNNMEQFKELCRAGILTNEAALREDGNHHGDMVDVAFLMMGFKAGLKRNSLLNEYEEISTIPYESENSYSASINKHKGTSYIFVKGSPEKLLSMCSHMLVKNKSKPIDDKAIKKQVELLAEQGYRIMAVAKGNAKSKSQEENLHNLTFLGLVGMIDPLRSESREAVELCKQAGIKVAMITGDHPITARAIAVDLGLCDKDSKVISGADIKRAESKGQKALDKLVLTSLVFARIEPQQKQQIVESLMRHGHFVAVTGDGVNDAPALRHAHVGVAMGKRGTDIAKESADLIITDDDFVSIVKGIHEGRIIYNNIRKVIFLLISTGASEITLFILTILAGLPMPLMATQILWMNLVTSGIQVLAMSFEPGDGDELKQPPRKPNEPIFDRLMISRVIVSALFIGSMVFATFHWLITHGYSLESARNMTLLLMVLFENIHVFNSRSERTSIFKQKFFSNPFLLISVIIVQAIHIAAMYTPGLKDILHIEAVSLREWAILLAISISVLVMGEIHKRIQQYGVRI